MKLEEAIAAIGDFTRYRPEINDLVECARELFARAEKAEAKLAKAEEDLYLAQAELHNHEVLDKPERASWSERIIKAEADRDLYKARLATLEAENDELNRIALKAVEDQQKAEARLENVMKVMREMHALSESDWRNLWDRPKDVLLKRAIAIAEGRDE